MPNSSSGDEGADGGLLTGTLLPGEYVVDFNYPLALAINVACIVQTLRLLWKSTRTEAVSASMKSTSLFRLFTVYNILLFSLCVLGVVVNEPRIHDNKKIYTALVIAIMVVHTLVKALLCLLVVLRGKRFISIAGTVQ